MLAKIRVEIVCFIDDSQPGFVECRLVDAKQQEWLFQEKVPVVSLVHLDSSSVYPAHGEIACRIIERKSYGNQEVVRIDTSEPWSINSVSGETQFEVLLEQLQEGY